MGMLAFISIIIGLSLVAAKFPPAGIAIAVGAVWLWRRC